MTSNVLAYNSIRSLYNWVKSEEYLDGILIDALYSILVSSMKIVSIVGEGLSLKIPVMSREQRNMRKWNSTWHHYEYQTYEIVGQLSVSTRFSPYVGLNL